MREGRSGRWQWQRQAAPGAQGEQGLQQQSHHQQQHQEGKGYRGPPDRRNSGRKYSCKPPPAPAPAPSDPCCQSVPLWEKKFCTDECLIPWKKVCETKKAAFMYENVMEWNDSAGEEVLHDAKCRYWAKVNGLPCDIPLPDPDMYIDIVDQDFHIDPELVEDLEKQPVVLEDDKNDTSLRWDSFLYSDIPVPVTGWGDTEDVVQATGWEGTNDPGPVAGWGYTEYPILDTRWGVTQGPVPVTGWEEAEASVPVTGWGDTDDRTPATGWGYSGYPVPVNGWSNEYSVPVTGWEGGEDTAPVGWNGSKEYLPGNNTFELQALSNDDVKHMNYDARESWIQNRSNEQAAHGMPTDKQQGIPLNDPKSFTHQRRGRHGKKRNGGQFGSRCAYPRFQEDGYQENFPRLPRTT